MEAIQSALHEGKHVVTEKAHNVMTSNAKIQDLQRNIQDTVKATSDGLGQTTDHGVKIPETDHWLKIVNPETGNIGPALLEDQIAREKVGGGSVSL
jgi:catalase